MNKDMKPDINQGYSSIRFYDGVFRNSQRQQFFIHRHKGHYHHNRRLYRRYGDTDIKAQKIISVPNQKEVNTMKKHTKKDIFECIVLFMLLNSAFFSAVGMIIGTALIAVCYFAMTVMQRSKQK